MNKAYFLFFYMYYHYGIITYSLNVMINFYDETGKEVYALDYVIGIPADMEKYELWVQDSLKKYELVTEPEFNQQY